MTEQPAPTPTPTSGNGAAAALRSQRLSDAMKKAHAKNPGAWKRKGDPSIEKRDARIRAALKANPQTSYSQIAKTLKLHVSRVYRVLEKDGRAREVRGSRGQVMERLGVTEAQVDKAKRAARLSPDSRRAIAHGVQPSQVAERHDKIRALLGQGLHPNQVAAQVGVDISTVYYVRAKDRGLDYRRTPREPRTQHVEQPFAETVNWLKHAYQEALAAIRKGRDPSISDCYAIVAYLKATGKG